jgi:glycosyltransferase involved in cell wall biosynthesis
LSQQAIRLVTNARTVSEIVRNLIKLPNVLGLIRLLEQWPTARVHTHWGTTTATVAMVASEVTGRPWSFTLHRGDIKANNLLCLKAQSASFGRCISDQGREWATHLIGPRLGHKLMTIPMGIKVPAECSMRRANPTGSRITAFVPARLVPVKGHMVLIQAMRILQKQHGGRLQCVFAGDGPERGRLEAVVRHHGLSETVSFAGALSREDVMAWYRSGRVDMAVLPSIVTVDGEHEGVPVSLMEAMAHGIPVISTRSGAIPELLEGAGILVEPNNSAQLAEAIGALCSTRSLAQRIAAAGRAVVQRRFNVDTIVPDLMSRIVGSVPTPRLEPPSSIPD